MSPIRPAPGEAYMTVLMPPRHFVAYQRWLAHVGLKLFVLPIGRAGGPAYSVTLSDARAEQENPPEPRKGRKRNPAQEEKLAP
jgi:hypothetical protein